MSLSMLIPFGILMGLKVFSIDANAPENLDAIRIFFKISCLLVIGGLAAIKVKVSRNTDTTEISAPVVLGTMEKMNQAAEESMAKKEGRTLKAAPTRLITIPKYDAEQLFAFAKTTIIGLVITVVIHYKWQYTIPLLIQGVMLPMKLFNHPLFKYYLRGQDVDRPFPEEDPMGAFKTLMGGDAPAPSTGKEKKNKKKN